MEIKLPPQVLKMDIGVMKASGGIVIKSENNSVFLTVYLAHDEN